MRSRIAVIVALISVSALAQEMTPLERPKGAPVTVSQYFTQFHHATPRRPRGRMHGAPNVIYGESADSAFIIPAAGNLAGANGTFFRSDFTLGNFANRNQVIGVAWLAAGVDNTN